MTLPPRNLHPPLPKHTLHSGDPARNQRTQESTPHHLDSSTAKPHFTQGWGARKLTRQRAQSLRRQSIRAAVRFHARSHDISPRTPRRARPQWEHDRPLTCSSTFCGLLPAVNPGGKILIGKSRNPQLTRSKRAPSGAAADPCGPAPSPGRWSPCPASPRRVSPVATVSAARAAAAAASVRGSGHPTLFTQSGPQVCSRGAAR